MTDGVIGEGTQIIKGNGGENGIGDLPFRIAHVHGVNTRVVVHIDWLFRATWLGGFVLYIVVELFHHDDSNVVYSFPSS